jgi:atrial natriuretic peptide receptor A
LESDAQKKKELEILASQLDVAKAKANNLISQMLPESVSTTLMKGEKVNPQHYACASVLFLDVAGFAEISEQIHPLEVVTLLNELYKTIDQVIEQYEVYKVETVGHTYLVVSGVPHVNESHAAEVTTMALHLQHSIDKFIFDSKPDIKIRVRIGINSGPLVAGVIGSKMPRYCLFGDTVNTASRMVTNGEADKIHISQSTFDLLNKDGNFVISSRGLIDVKGKGQMNTYWVESKANFDPSAF